MELIEAARTKAAGTTGWGRIDFHCREPKTDPVTFTTKDSHLVSILPRTAPTVHHLRFIYRFFFSCMCVCYTIMIRIRYAIVCYNREEESMRSGSTHHISPVRTRSNQTRSMLDHPDHQKKNEKKNGKTGRFLMNDWSDS